ncbi:MAG TPA: hypothetical protein VF522_07170 [Ramlibacter sp.]|uniref:hypothetical protein n=1 Tax=Ramlibacter sp. TaxID=1917967 RepID=UPI002ED022C3
MRFDGFQQLRQQPLRWLLVLALWLPFAQWAAAVHVLEHLHETTITADAEPKGLTACDTCVVAAALQAAAPVPPALPPALPTAGQSTPDGPVAAQVTAAPHLPYRSRAPPLPHA